jgi:hypothetical protein
MDRYAITYTAVVGEPEPVPEPAPAPGPTRRDERMRLVMLAGVLALITAITAVLIIWPNGA